MHHSRSVGILFAVAMLIVSLAAPAAAKKGGLPGPPSGTGLEVTVEPSSGLMWANSEGDQILFDITVTNTSGGDLTEVTVDFKSKAGNELQSWPGIDLGKNESWTTEYPYTVVGSISDGGNTGDFADAPISEQTQVTIGTVTATAGTVSDGADAVMTAYPVPTCEQELGGSFTFGPYADYSVCSFTGTGNWTLTTTLAKPPRGKSASPGATVRDGVPGNWCDYNANGDPLQPGEPYLEGGVWKVESYIYLPSDGICLHGGAAGETIPVRNTDTFYLATWTSNTVFGEPSTP